MRLKAAKSKSFCRHNVYRTSTHDYKVLKRRFRPQRLLNETMERFTTAIPFLSYGNDQSVICASLCHELSRLVYFLSLILSFFFSLWSTSKVVLCRRHATKIHGVGAESTSLRLVCAESWLLLSERESGRHGWRGQTSPRYNKVTGKRRRKTTATSRTTGTRKTGIHSSRRIIRARQKRAGGDVRFALNLLFAYTAEPPRQIYEVIKPWICFWKWYFAVRSILSRANAIACWKPAIPCTFQKKKKKSLDTLLPLLTLIMRFQAAAILMFSREARETTEYYPSVTSFAWFQGLPAKLRRAIFFFSRRLLKLRKFLTAFTLWAENYGVI